MGAKTLTKEELAAYRALARAAKRLREAQEAAAEARQAEATHRQQSSNTNDKEVASGSTS